MSIPFRRFVNITSGVGGGAGVRLRDLILRLFTTSELVPPQSQVEFADADAVGARFGTSSGEYARALFYFGFISKAVTRANKLSFARWADTATAPKVFGNKSAKALATFTAIAAGSLSVTMGADTFAPTAINLTGCVSLAAVATVVQTALRASAGVQFAAATVTFDATTNRFNLSGGVPGAGAMAVGVNGTGTDLAPLLGWTAASGAIINPGSAVESVSACLGASAESSNNFASFAFMPALTAAQVAEAALWNDTQNNMFMFLHRCTSADAATLSAALIGLSGAALTLSPLVGEYPALLPGVILAASDYSQPGAAQNFMYQQAALTPAVLTGADADTYDALRVNYYGRTQSAGQQIDFYQRGVLMGLPSDAVDMNVYANEIWLKDAAGAALLALQLALPKIPANASGRASILASLQDVVTRGLANGVISVGKTLSVQQRLYVSQLTGDSLAWVQVQNLGYWLDVVMQSVVTSDSRTEWKAVYKLVYGKDDAVRSVEGSHVLI